MGIGARCAGNLLSFRIHFLISGCSISNMAKRAGARIQVSHPQNKMGMRKTSICWVDSRCLGRSQWNRGWRKHNMLLRCSLQLIDRDSGHHTSKHLAIDCVQMAKSATSIVAVEPIPWVRKSIMMMNREGYRTDPCLTPRCTEQPE